MRPLRFHSRYVSAEGFYTLRRTLGLSRSDVSGLLSVSVRTVQNWETGGARVPWMAFKLLKLLRGYALPGAAWDGWTVRADVLYSPDGRPFPVADLYYLQNTFAQARLFRELYGRKGVRPDSKVVPIGRRPRMVLVGQGGMPSPADLPAVGTGGRS